jgi:hypothetical protein
MQLAIRDGFNPDFQWVIEQKRSASRRTFVRQANPK